MDFTNASHGGSATGMESYKNDLRTEIFDQLRTAIDNKEGVNSAVKSGWVGTAADNFIANIGTGSETLKESLQTVEDSLMNMLDGEIAQIYDMDENLVELEK